MRGRVEAGEVAAAVRAAAVRVAAGVQEALAGPAGLAAPAGPAGAAGAAGGRGGSSAASVTARGPALASMFQYQRARRSFDRDIDRPSLSPVGSTSARLLASPRKAKRKIPKVPFKVLDAPALQDDFYLNLVDWSSQNILAVGLGSCVYLWSACTSKVTKVGTLYFCRVGWFGCLFVVVFCLF